MKSFIAYLGLIALLLAALRADEQRKAASRGTISVPCEIVEVYDGDTLTVRVSLDLRVRLLDCWADEVHTKDQAAKVRGLAARDNLRKLAPVGSAGQLTIPLQGDRLDDVITLGRVLARVSVDDVDLSQEQVKAGHAKKDRP